VAAPLYLLLAVPLLPYTVHGMVSARLTSEQPGIITPVSKTFSLLEIYS